MIQGIRNTDVQASVRVAGRALRAFHELYLAAGGHTTRPDADIVIAKALYAKRKIRQLRRLADQLEEDTARMTERARRERV